MGLIELRVDKCHVSMSDLAVIQSFYRSVKSNRKQILEMSRDKRRYLFEQIIKRHHDNKAIYRAVMR